MSDILFLLSPQRIVSAVIEITAGTAFIMLAMLIAKKITRGKLSPKWRYAVWVTAAVRLLIPFNFPFFNLVANAVNLPVFLPKIEIIQPKNDYDMTIGAAEAWSWSSWATAETVDLSEILIPVYLIGAAVYLIYIFGGHISLNRIVKRFGKNPQKDYGDILKTVDVKKTPEIIICDKIASPMLMGFIRPKIILPHENYTKEEAAFVMTHEFVHLKRHDLYFKLLMHIITAVQWFNPIIHIMAKTVYEDIEITCDSLALDYLNAEQTGNYMRLMVKSAAKQKNASLTTSWSGSGKALKRRISENIEKHKEPSVLRPLLCSAAVICSGMFLSADISDNPFYYDVITQYPEEVWDLTSDESWKEITTDTDDLNELAALALDSYMSRFTGDDVPEYFRVNDYKITSAEGRLTRTQLKKYYFCETRYDVWYCNSNGNTYHNSNCSHSIGDGIYSGCGLAFMLVKTDNGYLITDYGNGSNGGTMVLGEFHHTNFDNYILRHITAMYAAGMFTGNTDFDNVTADQYADYCQAVKIINGQELFGFTKKPELFSTEYWTYHIGNDMSLAEAASNFDGEKYTGNITADSIPTLIFDGCSADLEKGIIYRTYIVSSDGSPTGNRLTLEFSLDDLNKLNLGRGNVNVIKGFTEEKGRFIHHPSQTDTITSLDIPYTTPESYLDYFKTPRDGYAFTVVDYKDISYEPDGVYAYVDYKGTIDGVTSAVPDPNNGSEWYVRLKILDNTLT